MKTILTFTLIGLASLSGGAVVAYTHRTQIDFDGDGTPELHIDNSAIGTDVIGGSSYPVWELRVSSDVELLRDDCGDLLLLSEGSVVFSGINGIWSTSPAIGPAEGSIASGFSGLWAHPYGSMQEVNFGFRLRTEGVGWQYGFANLDLYQNEITVFGTDEVIPLPFPGIALVSFNGIYLHSSPDTPITVIPEFTSTIYLGLGLMLLAQRRKRRTRRSIQRRVTLLFEFGLPSPPWMS